MAGSTVREVMSTDLVAVHRAATAARCAELMSQRSVRQIVVVDDEGKLEGLLVDLALLALELTWIQQDPVPSVAGLADPDMPAHLLAIPPDVIAHPEDDLAATFERLFRSSDDAVVVVDDLVRPVGILTEYDVARFAAEHGRPDQEVASVARRRLVTIDADQPRWLARFLMESAGVRHILVLRGSDLVGVLSLRDVMRLGRPADAPTPAGAEGPTPLSVAHLLGQRPLTVDATTNVRDAAQLMVDTGVGALPVLDPTGRPIGVVSRFDLLEASLRDGE